ncbi:DUF6314 family protein [Rhodovibrionaceae bacterium A322]
MVNTRHAGPLKAAARPPFSVENLQEYLAGDWRFTRQVEDDLHGASGHIIGQALWRREQEGLAYSEQGVFQRPGQGDLPCSQSYLYHLPGPAVAEVCFPDGRYFHDLDLRSGSWRAEHLCVEDFYSGSFQVLSADSWRMVWQIKGPRKDARLTTLFTRQRQG